MPSYVDSKSWGISKSLGGNEDGVSWKTVLGGFKVFNMPMDCLIHTKLPCTGRGHSPGAGVMLLEMEVQLASC